MVGYGTARRSFVGPVRSGGVCPDYVPKKGMAGINSANSSFSRLIRN